MITYKRNKSRYKQRTQSTLNHYNYGKTGLKKGKKDEQHKKSNRRDEVGRVAAQCIIFKNVNEKGNEWLTRLGKSWR